MQLTAMPSARLAFAFCIIPESMYVMSEIREE